MAAIKANPHFDKIKKRIENIDSQKVLNSLSFLVGIEHGFSQDGERKHFYSMLQQFLMHRGKEIGATNVHHLVLSVDTSSNILLAIEDKVSALEDRRSVKNLNHYLESILNKKDLTPHMAYYVGQHLANHFVKIEKINPQIKEVNFNQRERPIDYVKKFFEDTIKSKKILDCLQPEVFEKKSHA